jgi:hypothetical protein
MAPIGSQRRRLTLYHKVHTATSARFCAGLVTAGGAAHARPYCEALNALTQSSLLLRSVARLRATTMYLDRFSK